MMQFPQIPGCSFIYALVDPFTGEVRYIGETINLASRYRGHMGTAYCNLEKPEWVCGCILRGKKPIMIVLETVRGAGSDTERKWIRHFERAGARLLNVADRTIRKKRYPEHYFE